MIFVVFLNDFLVYSKLEYKIFNVPCVNLEQRKLSFAEINICHKMPDET